MGCSSTKSCLLLCQALPPFDDRFTILDTQFGSDARPPCLLTGYKRCACPQEWIYNDLPFFSEDRNNVQHHIDWFAPLVFERVLIATCDTDCFTISLLIDIHTDQVLSISIN